MKNWSKEHKILPSTELCVCGQLYLQSSSMDRCLLTSIQLVLPFPIICPRAKREASEWPVMWVPKVNLSLNLIPTLTKFINPKLRLSNVLYLLKYNTFA